MKFFKKNIEIENELRMSLDLTLDDTYTEISTLDLNVFDVTTFSESFTIKPGVTYSFNDWVDATFYLSHKIYETQSTNKKNESAIGFDLKVYFESKSTN